MAAANPSAISSFERHLTWWVLGCILVGIALGQAVPDFFQVVGRLKVAEVNLPVAVLIWLMIIPMLLKIDFKTMGDVLAHSKGIGVTLFINWVIKPFSMALLPAGQIDSYIAGLILLAAAPCTAMVFVWSQLCNGEPRFTLSQVALNDTIMLFAFAPLVALLLGLSSITVPWETLFMSVLMFILVPVVISQILRKVMLAKSHAALEALLKRIQPISLSALLATLILLFGFQGQQILEQPFIIALLAVPIIIQVYFNSMLAYWLNKKLKVAHCVAAPSALIGASNRTLRL
jgi:ACR3 family arsenite transporter